MLQMTDDVSPHSRLKKYTIKALFHAGVQGVMLIFNNGACQYHTCMHAYSNVDTIFFFFA